MIYHIGFMKGSGACFPLHRNGHRADTLIIQATRDVDDLSCDLWKYYGRREITKKQLRQDRFKILAAVNQQYGTAFKRVIVE